MNAQNRRKKSIAHTSVMIRHAYENVHRKADVEFLRPCLAIIINLGDVNFEGVKLTLSTNIADMSELLQNSIEKYSNLDDEQYDYF